MIIVRRDVRVSVVRTRPELELARAAAATAARLAPSDAAPLPCEAWRTALRCAELAELAPWRRIAAHRRARRRPGLWRRLAAARRPVEAPPWRAWVPGPADRPAPYAPTIVCRHGDGAARSILSCRISVTDTTEHRTPTWWAARLPDVAFELLTYPHGYLGRPTRRHPTRQFAALGRFDRGSHLPDYPLGLPRPVPPVIVITTPIGAVIASASGATDARGRPVYAIQAADWMRLGRRP